VVRFLSVQGSCREAAERRQNLPRPVNLIWVIPAKEDHIPRISELALIERIAARSAVRPGTEVGIGDDAAVIAIGGHAVVTHDLLVEAVHFRRSTTGLRDLGHKALAVNLSDVAAMGAEPVAALVGLGLPADVDTGDVDELYEGIERVAERFGVTVAGGDITAAPVLVLAVTALGRPWPGVAPVGRAGGRAGDLLCVTGRLGAAAAGLALLEDPGLAAGVDAAASLRAAHRAPQPRIEAGRALASGGVRAMLDLSDGLALDALRMAGASGLRARIDLDAVPLAPGVEAVAAARGDDPRILAATGGEDYELLAAVPPGLLGTLRAELDLPLTPVGRLEKGDPEVVAVDRTGRTVPLPRRGWEHNAEA
jgi:thiamine-monophosphate kinase